MSSPADSIAQQLALARSGSRSALGEALEACRGYLLHIARQQLDADLRAKAGASDLVQETFLEAQRDFAQFHGGTETELLAWLRQLLLHNIANFVRHYRTTAKRAVGREVNLRGATDRSSADGLAGLPGLSPSPSAQVQAQETLEQMQQALARLPEDYQEVIRLRNQARLPFDEIGKKMLRSADAARRLWSRAIERLEQEWETLHDSGS
jgi:RNA polymerase sigma-70 factor, ECF subfamily